ncbi:hypothetical protein [Flavobacterium sp. GNP001]
MFENIFNKKFKEHNSLTKLHLKGNVKEVFVRFEEKIDEKYEKQSYSLIRDHLRKYYVDLFFDSFGNLKEKVQYDSPDIIDYKNVYNFNSKNLLQSSVFKSTKDSYKSETNYAFLYLPNKIIINEKEHSNSKRKLIIENNSVKIDFYELDYNSPSGKKIFTKKTYVNELLNSKITNQSEFSYFYDDDKKIVKIELLYMKFHKTVQDFFYDRGILQKSVLKNIERNEIINENFYKTDIYGNWIEKIITNPNDKSIILISRKINYYSS